MGISLLPSFPIFLLLSLLTPSTALRLDLTHIDANGNFTMLELLQRTAIRSKHKIAKLTKTPAAIYASHGEYLIDLAIGTPAVPFSAIFDTGSSLLWTQCLPCAVCFPQPSPIFDPSKSSTYSKLPCNATLCQALDHPTCTPDCLYVTGYGDGSTSGGILSSERFSFGSETAQLGFGCAGINQGTYANASGIVGFGRSPLSIISQVGASEFSHCFNPLWDMKPSPLLIGSKPDSVAVVKRRLSSTPLVRNPLNPEFYYLSLLGITVGRTRLSIPKESLELKKDGTGGLIIDSGTSITRLEESVYKLFRDAILHHVKFPVANVSIGLDCFSLPTGVKAPKMPKVVFHFDGADWKLTKGNIFMPDPDTGTFCLTIKSTSGLSIFGNMQQQNTYVRYDLKNEKLSFAPARCDHL